MHSAATQSAFHFHVTQILIETPRQHLTTQPVGNIQHRFLSRHFAPTRHIVPFSVLGWDILILLKKIACHRETNPPLSPPFWRYAYACAMVFMTRILSFETDYPRVSRFPTRWSRGTKTLGTRLMDGSKDTRSYGRTLVQSSKPNFLAQMGYHIFLSMVVRARTFGARGSAINNCFEFGQF